MIIKKKAAAKGKKFSINKKQKQLKNAKKAKSAAPETLEKIKEAHNEDEEVLFEPQIPAEEQP